MKITSIKIDKLFEIFDYDISFSNKENLLIITGPNGFGKTTILNIIFNLFNRKLSFFAKLSFEKITICLDEKISITISKNLRGDKSNLKFTFAQNDKIIKTLVYSKIINIDILQGYLPIANVDIDEWIDHSSRNILSTNDLIDKYEEQLPDDVLKNVYKFKSKKVDNILDSIKVHLIKEQRLFRTVKNQFDDYDDNEEQTITTETIQTYANELTRLMESYSNQLFVISQELDSSYPNRLISETAKVSEEKYNVRFNKLKEKQEKLERFNLYEGKLKVLKYSKDDSKALLVYLKDFEHKLGVFDNILEKLELFTNILNERRFTHKTIQIDRYQGFYFKTKKGKELELTQLSSGEKHEVILLYELIFNAKPNTLILIDEPEISLHVTWQKEFINDLLRIIEIQNIQVLTATHSPSIINGKWSLVYKLGEIEA